MMLRHAKKLEKIFTAKGSLPSPAADGPLRQAFNVFTRSAEFSHLASRQPTAASITSRLPSPGAPTLPCNNPLPRLHAWAPYLPPRRLSSSGSTREKVQSALKAAVSAPALASQKAMSMLPPSVKRMLDSLHQPSSLQRAVSLQLEAAWQRHRTKLLGAGLLTIAYLVWRTMRMTASAFVDVSQSMAVTGVISLGAALSMLGAAWLYRRHFIISPAAVYRAAMLRLNTHPGALEVLGAPLVGSDVRASVLTGGGLKIKGLRPKLRSRRVAMIFPLKGSERRGLVSVEAKKKSGKLRMTLLAVDVPLPAALGGEQRIYLDGGPKAYGRGGVLDELRRPFLAALTSEEAADAEDAAEEAKEEEEERLAAAVEKKVAVAGDESSAARAVAVYKAAYQAARGWAKRVAATVGTQQQKDVQQ